jgi:phosphoribosylanthranilate isomerase
MTPNIALKYCGFTQVDDITTVLTTPVLLQTVTHVGLIMAPASPRVLATEQAQQLVKQVKITRIAHAVESTTSPLSIPLSVVGVFQNQPLEWVLDQAKQIGLDPQHDMIQLHGNETPEYCQAIQQFYPVVKAICPDFTTEALAPPSAGANTLMAVLYSYQSACTVVLIDRPKGAQLSVEAWHTALIAAWQQHPSAQTLPNWWLAGGLTPLNVSSTMHHYHANGLYPNGVDVASGIEAPNKPGIKAPQHMVSFAQHIASLAHTAYDNTYN